MFLIDPHPANFKVYGLSASFNPNLAGILFEVGYKAFENGVNDVPVTVDANVNLVEEWYEQNPYSDFTGQEGLGNLWGLTPGKIQVVNPAQTLFPPATNLSAVIFNGGHIGHTETHEWFQSNVVPTLLMPTYSSFQPSPADRYSKAISVFGEVIVNGLDRSAFASEQVIWEIFG